MKTIAFFNNKGGVGKTTLVYHLAWMLANKGHNTLAVDLDPQANLSAISLNLREQETLWDENPENNSIYTAIKPVINISGEINDATIFELSANLSLIAGDLNLSTFEDQLAETWPKCLDSDERAFKVTTALYRVIHKAAVYKQAEIVLLDVGPNLGAINRSALLCAEMVVVPIGADMFSVRGLLNLGPTLQKWRKGWKKRLDEVPNEIKSFPMPKGSMQPIGYVLLQHNARANRPVRAYENWANVIPNIFRHFLLNDEEIIEKPLIKLEDDENCLGLLKNYQSLMPMAMSAHKPMFHLKPADGAIGAHVEAVKRCYDDFSQLADRILASASE